MHDEVSPLSHKLSGFYPAQQRQPVLSPDVLRQHFPHRRGDLFYMSFKREVSSIQKLHDCIGIVPLESLGAWRDKKRIVFAPDGQ